jgi:hypothetical protein
MLCAAARQEWITVAFARVSARRKPNCVNDVQRKRDPNSSERRWGPSVSQPSGEVRANLQSVWAPVRRVTQWFRKGNPSKSSELDLTPIRACGPRIGDFRH